MLLVPTVVLRQSSHVLRQGVDLICDLLRAVAVDQHSVLQRELLDLLLKLNDLPAEVDDFTSALLVLVREALLVPFVLLRRFEVEIVDRDLADDPKVMGRFAVTRRLKALGWLATGTMAAAVAAMFATW